MSLIVIGGGPAGMAAAIEASRAGMDVTLMDESPSVGGQIYRELPKTFEVREPKALGKDFLRGQQLKQELAAQGQRVQLMSETEVLGLWPHREVLFASRGRSGSHVADQVILATGAYDRPVPIQGWTLPGVMTAGGAQAFVKTMRVRPGRRALVAGTGPLLLVVATQLAQAGIEVVAVLEAGHKPPPLAALGALWGHWGLLRDAAHYYSRLRQARIPVLYNHAVFRAHGREAVESVEYGAINPEDWSPLRSQWSQAAVDMLVVGYGFVPNTQLAFMAGCKHRYALELGGWVPERDALLRTSVQGIYSAGDGAGVAGSISATEEGRVAGITAAEAAGALTHEVAEQRRAGPLKKLRALKRVRTFLDELSRIRPGLARLAEPETIMCRCEVVTNKDVEFALAQGAKDLQAVKLLTRLGMGACQGCNCAPSTALHVSQRLGCPLEAVGQIRPRPPVKPVTLGTLASDAIEVRSTQERSGT